MVLGVQAARTVNGNESVPAERLCNTLVRPLDDFPTVWIRFRKVWIPHQVPSLSADGVIRGKISATTISPISVPSMTTGTNSPGL